MIEIMKFYYRLWRYITKKNKLESCCHILVLFQWCTVTWNLTSAFHEINIWLL